MTDQVRAPVWPVAGAAAAAALATALAVTTALGDGASVPALATGYVLGAVVTVVLAVAYRSTRNARRPHPRFRVQPALDRTATAALALGFAAGLANAFLLATELAK